MKVGMMIFNRDLCKGIQFLVDSQLLTQRPSNTVDFLAYEDYLSREAIKKCLTQISDPIVKSVVAIFVSRIDFQNTDLIDALWNLFGCFQPVRELEQNEFLINVLKDCYIQQNVGSWNESAWLANSFVK